jgi:hypothetical protein
MSSAESPSKLKKVINFILSLLALLKWVPFLGKWRPIILALSTVLGTLSAIKCDPPANKEQPKIDPTTPVPTPVRTPSPSPTPTPQEIILDRVPQAGWPFHRQVHCTVQVQHSSCGLISGVCNDGTRQP